MHKIANIYSIKKEIFCANFTKIIIFRQKYTAIADKSDIIYKKDDYIFSILHKMNRLSGYLYAAWIGAIRINGL